MKDKVELERKQVAFGKYLKEKRASPQENP